MGATDGDAYTVLDADRVRHSAFKASTRRSQSGRSGRRRSRPTTIACSGRTSGVERTAKDRNGRILGHVHAGGDHVNLSMVRNGYAWHFKRYSKDKDLADAETEAREAGRGLWGDPEPLAPWEFRMRAREKAAAK